MRSPAVRSMSISRPPGWSGDVVGEAHEVVGGLAHRRDDDDDVVARRGGCGRRDRPRPGCDRGRRPRCRRTSAREAHGHQGYRRAPASHERIPARRYIQRPMPSADKRATQEGERPRTRARQREAALKQQEAQPRRSATSAIVAAVFVGRDRDPDCVTGGKEQEEGGVDDHDRRPRRRPAVAYPTGCVATVAEARRSRQAQGAADDDRPDQDLHRDYHDDLRRRSTITLDAKDAPKTRRTASCSSPSKGFYDGLTCTGSSRTS